MTQYYTHGQIKWLQTGLELLGKSGVDSITIESLGKKLNLSKGSFYHHFQDRDAYLDQLIQYWESSMTNWVINMSEAESDNHAKKLQRLADLTSSTSAMPIERAIRHWARQDNNVAKTLKRVEKKRYKYLEYLLTEIRVDQPVLMSRMIYAIFIGAQYLAPPASRTELLKMYQQLILLDQSNTHPI